MHQKIQFDYGEHKWTIQINRPQQFVRKTFRLSFLTQIGSKYEKAQGKYSAKRKHKEENAPRNFLIEKIQYLLFLKEF